MRTLQQRMRLAGLRRAIVRSTVFLFRKHLHPRSKDSIVAMRNVDPAHERAHFDFTSD
jgi:hypothetical protein